MRLQRGAALTETVLVIGMILTFLLTSVQVGVLGFLQVTADAASFVNARQSALGVTDVAGPAHATQAIFPQLAQSDISATPLPAPSATVGTDYGYNSSNAQTQANSAQNRHGGVSMIQPALWQSQVRPHQLISVLNHLTGVSAQNFEPSYVECGIHYNVANSTSGACNPSVPGAYYEGSYFSLGENTPPYYVGANLMNVCQNPQPWSTCTESGTNSSTGRAFIGLGVAEHLDYSNWRNGHGGIGGGAESGTFTEAACHQRVYAALAQFFARYPQAVNVELQYEPSYIQQQFYHPISSFNQWAAFETNQNNQSDPAGHAADLAIQQIYDWDSQYLQAGYNAEQSNEPGTYPLYPDGNNPNAPTSVPAC